VRPAVILARFALRKTNGRRCYSLGVTTTEAAERCADPWWTASMLLPSGSSTNAA
jgi:hypothetical protein